MPQYILDANCCSPSSSCPILNLAARAPPLLKFNTLLVLLILLAKKYSYFLSPYYLTLSQSQYLESSLLRLLFFESGGLFFFSSSSHLSYKSSSFLQNRTIFPNKILGTYLFLSKLRSNFSHQWMNSNFHIPILHQIMNFV